MNVHLQLVFSPLKFQTSVFNYLVTLHFDQQLPPVAQTLAGPGREKASKQDLSFSLSISHITLSSLLFSLSLITIMLRLCHGNWFFKIYFCGLSVALRRCWFTSARHLCPVWDLAFKVLPHCHISAINLNIQEQQRKNVPALNNLQLLICCLHLLLYFFLFFLYDVFLCLAACNLLLGCVWSFMGL